MEIKWKDNSEKKPILSYTTEKWKRIEDIFRKKVNIGTWK